MARLGGRESLSLLPPPHQPSSTSSAGTDGDSLSQANDASGYIGAAIVGCFAAILLLAWVVSWVVKRRQVSKPSEEPKTATAIVDTEKSGDA